MEKKIGNLESENQLLRKQNNEFRELAQKSGSEMSIWKHKYLKLEEEYNKLKLR